eukprot:m.65586 g.65586  ORF g.65586 m.65586 type:complete len:201 (-) comp12064_c1_seq3:233-835(-)
MFSAHVISHMLAASMPSYTIYANTCLILVHNNHLLACIGVDRSKRNGVIATLEKYFTEASADDYHVFIFPEGSTSNGNGLLKFKPGVFSLNQTVSLPICLEYQCPPHVSVALNKPTPLLDCIHAMWFMGASKTVVVNVLPHTQLGEEESAAEYADRVANQMAETLDVPYCQETSGSDAVFFFTALEHQYRKGLWPKQKRE